MLRWQFPANSLITSAVAVRSKNRMLVVLWGITSLWTRNPSKECLPHKELSAHGHGFHWKMAIPPRITSSLTRNPPQEWDSDGNCNLIDKEPCRGRGFRRESPTLWHTVRKESEFSEIDNWWRKNSVNYFLRSRN
jgi:hypothetical protein